VAGVGDASLVVAGFAGLFPNAMIVTLPAAACGGGSAASARARGH